MYILTKKYINWIINGQMKMERWNRLICVWQLWSRDIEVSTKSEFIATEHILDIERNTFAFRDLKKNNGRRLTPKIDFVQCTISSIQSKKHLSHPQIHHSLSDHTSFFFCSSLYLLVNLFHLLIRYEVSTFALDSEAKRFDRKILRKCCTPNFFC